MISKPRKRVRLLCPQVVMAGLLAWLSSSAISAGGTLQPYEDQGTSSDFNLVDIKGNTHTLTDYRGKIVVVNFWASWCPPCIQEMPSMQRLQEKLAGQPFVILPINVGEKKYRVWKFVKLINFTLPVPLDTDSKVFADWGASVLPTSFLLDTEGHIRYRAQGELEWDSDEVTTLIEELINGEENKQ